MSNRTKGRMVSGTICYSGHESAYSRMLKRQLDETMKSSWMSSNAKMIYKALFGNKDGK